MQKKNHERDYWIELYVKPCLENYLRTKTEESFLELYKQMEYKLKCVVWGDFTSVYSPLIRKQKYYRIRKVEQLSGLYNQYIPNYNHENSMESAKYVKLYNYFQKYSKDFIDQYQFSMYDGRGFNLLSPFWEVLNKLKLDEVTTAVAKYQTYYYKYLLVKFADFYWDFFFKSFRNDILLTVTNITETNKTEMQDTDYLDNKLYKQGLFSSIIVKDDIFDTEEIKSHLKPVEFEVFKLIVKNFKHPEIAMTLGISQQKSRKIKLIIKRKLEYLKEPS